jgi:Arc/MetJ-type ribon-helix-helix transcriptional regulator
MAQINNKSNGLPKNSESAQRITVVLTPEDIALLDEISHGNPSEGIRLALRAWRREAAARLNEAARIVAEIEADPTRVVAHDELQQRLATKKAARHVMAT